MSNNAKGRTISAAVLVLVLGVFFHVRGLQYGRMGREAFLAYQTKRYDRHYAFPEPWSSSIFPSVVLFGGFLATYELLSLGIIKILDRRQCENSDLNG